MRECVSLCVVCEVSARVRGCLCVFVRERVSVTVCAAP